MEYKFSAENYHDLKTHKEFTKAYNLSLGRSLIFRIVLTLLMIWYISLFQVRYVAVIFLVYAASYFITVFSGNKKGDAAFRRMVTSNGGIIPHASLQFCEDRVLDINLDHGGRIPYSYDLFQSLVESENLLILTMQDMLALVIPKDTLSGGTVEEFKAWFLDKCPNIKKKKAKKLGFGKFIHGIYLTVMVLGVIIALLSLFGISLQDRLSGTLHNGMTYQEIAAELAPLGIAISEDTIQEMEAYDEEYALEFGDYYADNPNASKVLDLLYWEGAGIFDEDSMEWTPSNSGIYWFDLEVMDVSSMYTNILTGIDCLSEELAFTNIEEDHSMAQLEAGTGPVNVSFDYQGQRYVVSVQYDYDWVDVNFLFEIMDILSQDPLEENLYYSYDGQGVYLYYGTEDQVRQLEQKTGTDFYNTTTGFGF